MANKKTNSAKKSSKADKRPIDGAFVPVDLKKVKLVNKPKR